MMMGCDFRTLDTDVYETKNWQIDAFFSQISVNSIMTDVEILPSENDECRVVITEKTKLNHSVNVENEELKIQTKDNRKWYETIGISFTNPDGIDILGNSPKFPIAI